MVELPAELKRLTDQIAQELVKEIREMVTADFVRKLGPSFRGGILNGTAVMSATDTTIGVVQPDGTTTTVADPVHHPGVLSAAIPLDGVSTGTIAYYDATATPPGWVLLPIT